MSYRPGPDDTYYEDWAMSDEPDDGIVHIDLAKVIILLWIIVGSLL